MASLTALLFGATIAIAIGPIALLIINVAATAGLRAGLASGTGAAAADFSYALVAFLAGGAAVRLLLGHRHTLQIAASLLLIVFGAWLAARALREPNSRAGTLPNSLLHRPFASTYSLTVVNPLTIIAFAGFAPQLPLADSPALAVWYAACVALGSLAVQFALALGGGALGRALEQGRGLRIMNGLSGAGIAAFGFAGLVRPFTR